MTLPLTDTVVCGDPDSVPMFPPQGIDMQYIGGADRICETLFPRMGALAVAGPFYHMTGFLVRSRFSVLLLVFMGVLYIITFVVLVTQDLYGADLDDIYWIAPGHCSPLLCMY